MYGKPQYNTPEYWQAVKAGIISWEDANNDEKEYLIRRKRSLETCHRYDMNEKPRYDKPNTAAYTPEMSAIIDEDKNL